jgi:hypothetical protein
MKEFILLFRMDITTKEAQPSKEQMADYMKSWMQCINELADQNQLAGGGNHLSPQGRVLKPNNERIESPYISEKNSVAGYIIVLAQNLDEATNIAIKCPILAGENTSVEIREVASPGN